MKATTGGRAARLGIGLATMIVLAGACGGGASQAPRGETTEETRSTTSVRLELAATNYDSGVVVGSATFTKTAAGTEVELKLRDLPEPNETYLAHLHRGSCEDKEHSAAPEGETSDHHGHEHGQEEHADAHDHEENKEATAEEIEYPLTPVESNAADEGSSTTMLQGVALGELFSHGPRYLNVHAAGSGDPSQLTCANLREASLRTTSENTT